MNYFKGLVSNVRGFYSEINSATLTGAIDVVVVRQEDGTCVGSPFHVRFGKLGVLRSREKIIDIMINGEPIDLQMKLGDAGEAFFVEEVEEPMDITSDMSTSPIPPQHTQTTDKVEQNEGEENSNAGQIQSAEEREEDAKTPTPETLATDEKCSSDKERGSESGNTGEESSTREDEESKEPTTTENKENDQDKETLEEGKGSNDNGATADEKQTEITEVTEQIGDTEAKDSETVKEMEVKDEIINTTKDTEKCSDDVVEEKQSDDDTTQQGIDIPGRNADDPDKAEAEVDGDSIVNPEEEELSHSYSESIPIPRRQAEAYEESDSSNWMTDSTSLPHEEGFRRSHMYPLSDQDSPIGSPHENSGIHLQPLNLQHYLSDTEAEIQQSQDNKNVNNEVTWNWGKLPKGPEGAPLQERKLSDHKRDEGSHGHGYRSKRKSHKIKEEGIYLEDLTGIDQEVAALYLNQALKSRDRRQVLLESPSTEDRESGIGQSLPSSPTAEISGSKDTGCESYNNIALSLCGDLKSGKVPLENFIESLITFEDLSSNPSLLNDPKLVLRINDRYYNWQIAAPMLMSHMVYQRPLQQEAVKSLVKLHMPKKEKRKGYYWFSWRQNYEEQSSGEEDFDPVKDKHRPRVHSGSRKPLTTTPNNSYTNENIPDDVDQDKDKQPMTEQESIEQQQRRQRNASECTSGNESDIGYRKTIRLNSEQLSNLNLHDGANSIHFSVTTQYQGTAECHATIYLWNYDDRIVISDIDGTITKSDVLGQILPVVGQAWAQSGVAHFFSSIGRNGYKLLYLSARAIGQAQLTRDYLKSVNQDQIFLPDGPLLLSPASLIKAFHREVIEKKPEEFKIAALRDILSLFPSKKPFYSGFGNKINDVYSYRAVGVSLSRIFTINHKGEVKNELITTFQSSYVHLRDLVDQMFPPYKKHEISMKPSGLIAPEEFSSFTYWRIPLPEVDLREVEPPSETDEATPAS